MRLIRGSCRILAAASAALRKEFHSGATAREAIIGAEKAAAAAGAQDIRVLASLSKGGTPTAIDYPKSDRLDPLLAYIAVRHAGYWAEGNLTLAAVPGETLQRAQDALAAMIAKAKVGASVAELKAAGQEKLGGLHIHPAAATTVTGIGLALVETEAEPSGVARLEAGRVYSIRAGARRAEGDAALLSAMIEPGTSQAELWSALA
jgi:hypothetical protein